MFDTSITLSPMSRKPMPSPEKKVGLAARVDPVLLNALADLAEADERTLSFMVERAIREYIERHGKPHPAAAKRK